MRISIRHETTYRLEEAARRSMQYLRLTPRHERNQRTLHWVIKGPDQLTRWRDGFGNDAHFATTKDDHALLTIYVEGEVETKETNGILSLDDGLPPNMFLKPTRLIKRSEMLDAFSEQFTNIIDKQGELSALHLIMKELHDKVKYKAGVSTVATPANEAFEKKQGVCQDFAHLFIAICHYHQIPARYVSGYLTEGAGVAASHAWAEAYVPDLGWVSFDGANCQCATEQYVRLAVGYDYTNAAPIIGVRSGGEGEKMEVNVSVSVSQSQTQG